MSTKGETMASKKKVVERSIENIKEPNENDVLCGKGCTDQEHAGNIQLRKIVDQTLPEYLATKRLEKKFIAAKIVEQIRSMNPPGRFLDKDLKDGPFYYEIGDKRALEKTMQTFRYSNNAMFGRRFHRIDGISSEASNQLLNDKFGAVRDVPPKQKRQKQGNPLNLPCGHPNIYIRYEKASGNERNFNISLEHCSIACKDGFVTTNDVMQQTTATCGLEHLDLAIHVVKGSGVKATCVALCISATSNYPNLQTVDSPILHLQPNPITYVLPTSKKQLIKPSWNLKHQTAGDAKKCKPNVASAGTNVTLQHLSFTLNALWKSDTAINNCCRLNLGNCNISDDVCAALCSALLENSSITHLSLQSNQIGKVGCEELANILSKNQVPSLFHLNMGNNNIGDKGCKTLFVALQYNTSITNLNLEGNRIGDDACKKMGRALESNDFLTHLNIQNNYIGDRGCVEICEDGLDYNMSLQSLNLKSNDIGDDGCGALLDVVESTNSTLTDVELSDNNKISSDLLLYFQQTMADRLNSRQ